MEKRALSAIVLSVLILLGYQLYISKFYPQAVSPLSSAAPKRLQTQSVGTEAPIYEIETPSEKPRPHNRVEEKEFVAETEHFILAFTSYGGSIKKVELKDYPDPVTKKPLILVQSKGENYNVAALTDLYNTMPLQETGIYDISEEGNKIICRYKDEKFAIEKIFYLNNSMNNIDLQIKIQNLTNSDVVTSYKIITASYIDATDAFESRYLEVDSKINGRVFRDKKNIVRSGEVSWSALKNKYFSVILKPTQPTKSVFIERIDNKNLSTGMETASFTILPKEIISQQYFIYIGPTDIDILKKYGAGLEETVNYGVFGGISIFLLHLLTIFNKIFHSWGLSIICVTFLINLVLYPLTVKSYKSMKQLQELQPHMEKLREIHKDNPQKLNKELLELYRKYKVNPMGGCLPLLLQMPIIVAMYNSVMRSINLKGANFLWIKDLSKPDAISLPFSLPFIGPSINILPILMVIAMVVQQKISPLSKSQAKTEQQRQQQTIMMIMPVMFGVIFYNLPSGLVIYWLVNTVVMAFNQYRVVKAT